MPAYSGKHPECMEKFTDICQHPMKILKIFFAILCYAGSYSQIPDPFRKVDSILQAFEAPAAPGLSIGILSGGKLVYSKGIGLADVDKGTRNSSSSVFGIASVTKQFTAGCVWRLVKDGKISLEDDIRTYIPELPSYGKPMLIRHLLNHTNGLRNYHALMELAGFDYDREFHDNQTILELACRQQALNNSPGEKVIYGNTGYTLLAIAIERITGQDLAAYAKSHLFGPLGMHHTYYRIGTNPPVADAALGYIQHKDGRFEHLAVNQNTYGAGSAVSSVKDLAVWSNILNGLNPDYSDLTKFLTTVEKLPSGETAKYARGVMVDAYKGMPTVHHSGYGLGGQSQIIAVPQLNLAVVILTNLQSIDPTPLSYRILDLFMPAGQNTSDPAVGFSYDKRDLIKFTGQYKEQYSDMKLEIIIENDTLKAVGRQGGKPIALTAAKKGTFTRSNNAQVLYEFSSEENPAVDLIVYFGGAPFYFSRAQFSNREEATPSDYAGRFFSEELSVTYDIYNDKGDLLLNYPNHHGIKLVPGQTDEFGNGQRVLYHFERNRNKQVVALLVSAEGTVKNIRFIKK